MTKILSLIGAIGCYGAALIVLLIPLEGKDKALRFKSMAGFTLAGIYFTFGYRRLKRLESAGTKSEVPDNEPS